MSWKALRSASLSVLALAASLVILAGCTVHLIMDYDATLDQGITTVQSTTEQFLSQLDNEVGTPAAAFSATPNQTFYVNMDAQLRTLASRAQSEPNSDIVVKQIATLQSSFATLKGLHQSDGDKGLGHLEITSTRSALENEFVSILTLQLALKNRLKTPATVATAPTVTH